MFKQVFDFKSYTKKQWAWALYDWGNSAFATTIMAGFFPLFFKQYYASSLVDSQSTAVLAYTNAISLLLVFIFAPALGRLSDLTQNKKKILFLLTLLGAISCLSLSFIPAGFYLLAALAFILANFAFSSACAPYDALLLSVSTPKQRDRVSALGYSLGYFGGGLLFALNILMYVKPELFFLNSGVQGIQLAFASVAFWWVLFTLPLMRVVKEPARGISSAERVLHKGLKSFFLSIGKVFSYSKEAKYFLIAFLFYADGVGTLIRMAADYGVSIGFGATELMGALLMVQIVGFPATLLMGFLSDKFHPQRMIMGLIFVYLVIVAWGSVLSSPWEFYVVVFLLGMSQGGIQALSRSLFTRLIPAGREGEFFGVYNILGKFAGVAGTFLIGSVTWLSGSHRLGLMSVALLFVLGAYMLNKIQLIKGE